MNDKPLPCPKCNKEPRVVACGAGSYVRCPWCDKSTYMQNTAEDAVRLWNATIEEEFTMKNRGICNLYLNELFPHPDNPRKDLGDLSEMTESVKKNGIMQNLTVIPGHYAKNEFEEGAYTVIIGHRRLAAAKAAGIAKVPCRIIEGMTHKEQVSTMLEENMQRSDLTIYEQAQGFQMMLDLGETIDSIVEKTGFSKTTVNRRLNIAKLDQELIKEKEKDECFQLSLSDLYALERIEDVETRNEVLKNASNHQQLIWKVENTVTEAKRKKTEDAIVAKLTELGVKKAPKKAENEIYTSKWKEVKSFSLDKEVPENITLKGKELYYLRRWSSIQVIKKNTKEEKKQNEYEIEKKRIDANKKKINAKAKQAAVQMKEFVRNFVNNKLLFVKEQSWYKEALWKMLKDNNSYVGNDRLVAFLLEKELYSIVEKDRQETEETIRKMKMYQQMLCILVYSLDTELADYNGYYNQDKGKRLMTIHDFLMQLGFTFDDDEYEQILDGTHELYEVKEEAKP